MHVFKSEKKILKKFSWGLEGVFIDDHFFQFSNIDWILNEIESAKKTLLTLKQESEIFKRSVIQLQSHSLKNLKAKRRD